MAVSSATALVYALFAAEPAIVRLLVLINGPVTVAALEGKTTRRGQVYAPIAEERVGSRVHSVVEPESILPAAVQPAEEPAKYHARMVVTTVISSVQPAEEPGALAASKEPAQSVAAPEK